MDKVDTIVIGAGVIGLAVARSHALKGNEVLLLDAEDHVGSGVSSRNSGVIHAGFYYDTDSLKAIFCTKGKDALYAYCRERGVLHRQTGKLVVATNESDSHKLSALLDQGKNNGVYDLRIIDQAALKQLEPNVRAHTALLSPSTGIVDVHDLMTHLTGDFENAGGTLALETSITSGHITDTGFVLHIGDDYKIACNKLVNAGGLGAQAIARSITGFPSAHIPPQYLAKGNYFALEGKAPFNHLIYPLPSKSGLGAHSLVDFGGRVRFGPDVEWVDRLDYKVNESRKAAFVKAIRSYYPALDAEKLHSDFAGIRPKIVGPDIGVTDFMISGEQQHGIKGMINLFGIESPGLTSSLAIGPYVAEMLTR